MFAEKNPSQSGFPAGNWSGNTNDLTGRSLKCQVIEKRCTIFIRKAKRTDFYLSGAGCRQRFILFLGSHKRKDTFPGNLGFLDRIKKLGCVGRFYGQPGKTGKESTEGSDIPGSPACPNYIFTSKIEDEKNTGHGNKFINRRKSSYWQVCAHRSFFVICQVGFVVFISLGLTAVNTVGNGILDAVQSGSI